MDIIVDTREQKPLFTKREAIFFKLEVGDYSTKKLRNSFCIERKSLQDLYSTIIQNHVRFRNELIRAEVHGIELVMVIEGSRKKFVSKNFPGGHRRNIEGRVLDKIIATMETRYKLKIHWCLNRSEAKNKIIYLLLNKEKSQC